MAVGAVSAVSVGAFGVLAAWFWKDKKEMEDKFNRYESAILSKVDLKTAASSSVLNPSLISTQFSGSQSSIREVALEEQLKDTQYFILILKSEAGACRVWTWSRQIENSKLSKRQANCRWSKPISANCRIWKISLTLQWERASRDPSIQMTVNDIHSVSIWGCTLILLSAFVFQLQLISLAVYKSRFKRWRFKWSRSIKITTNLYSS